jgi:hypothetical protein
MDAPCADGRRQHLTVVDWSLLRRDAIAQIFGRRSSQNRALMALWLFPGSNRAPGLLRSEHDS